MRKILTYLLGEDATERNELVANVIGVAAFWVALALALITVHVFG